MLKSVLDQVRSAFGSRSGGRRLHIGGKVRKDGWEVLNVNPGPHVDHLGNAKDLSRFADGTFLEIYASHILEHLDFTGEMQAALFEWRRVLVPSGRLYVAVPDMTVLSALFLEKDLALNERFGLVKLMYGAHEDAYDHHKVGFDFTILQYFLTEAGFVDVVRVPDFELFDDTSRGHFAGRPISLNAVAYRPRA
jgi:predicted SAM-dependent methyltransferase